MALAEWKPELSVGVLCLDDGHRHLLRLLAQLRSALQQSWEALPTSALLNELLGYARSHFHTEEQHMDSYGYPALAPHRAEHQQFTSRMIQCCEQILCSEEAFSAKRLELPTAMLAGLEDWLLCHIQNADGAYARYLEALRTAPSDPCGNAAAVQ